MREELEELRELLEKDMYEQGLKKVRRMHDATTNETALTMLWLYLVLSLSTIGIATSLVLLGVQVGMWI